MTETSPTQDPSSGYGQPQYGQPRYGNPPAAYGFQPGGLGKIRGTGIAILLFFVTFGIYSFVYYYSVHEEMKRHSGRGVGGGVGLLLAFLVGIASPYILSAEVGELHARAGRARPVSGLTGLWSFPGVLILVGPFIWFVKTNGALNDYWRSLGAR